MKHTNLTRPAVGFSSAAKTRRTRTLPNPDRLDRVALILILLALGAALPVFIGSRNTPWLGGRPALLNPGIRAEQAFVATARRALALLGETDQAVTGITPVSGASESYGGSQRMQERVEKIETMIAEWRTLTPPGRFAGLHKRLADALAVSQRMATEGWAYYGDLNPAHLSVLRQALPASQTERAQIMALLDAMDFEMAPPPAPLITAPQPAPRTATPAPNFQK